MPLIWQRGVTRQYAVRRLATPATHAEARSALPQIAPCYTQTQCGQTVRRLFHRHARATEGDASLLPGTDKTVLLGRGVGQKPYTQLAVAASAELPGSPLWHLPIAVD